LQLAEPLLVKPVLVAALCALFLWCYFRDLNWTRERRLQSKRYE